jgi:hypothetical protein
VADQADLGPFEANGRLNINANAAKSSKGGFQTFAAVSTDVQCGAQPPTL